MAQFVMNLLAIYGIGGTVNLAIQQVLGFFLGHYLHGETRRTFYEMFAPKFPGVTDEGLTKRKLKCWLKILVICYLLWPLGLLVVIPFTIVLVWIQRQEDKESAA